MDSRFEDIYQELYDGYGEFLSARALLLTDVQAAMLVRSVIERIIATGEFDGRVRIDARYFLLVNFTEMISIPLLRDRNGEVNRARLESDLQQDVTRILNRAGEFPTQDEISGGDVLQAVSDTYTELRVARFRVWN